MKDILITACIAWLLISAVPADAGQASIKSVKAHVEPGLSAPIWVSAAAAGSEKGGLNAELLPELDRFVERLKTMDTGEDCLYFGVSEITGPREAGFLAEGNLEELGRNALTILEGRVGAIEVGFYAQQPGAVLEVQVDEIVRGNPAFTAGQTIYLHYPQARFSVGDLEVCKEDGRFPPRPESGDRVLVFALRRPLDSDRELINPTPNGVFYEKVGGALVVPPGLQDSASLQDVETIEDLRQVLSRQGDLDGDGINTTSIFEPVRFGLDAARKGQSNLSAEGHVGCALESKKPGSSWPGRTTTPGKASCGVIWMATG